MGAIYDIAGNEIIIDHDIPDYESRTMDISGIPYIHFIGKLPTDKSEGALGVQFVFGNNTERINGYATLKVQGNSTTAYPKKNFTLKLFFDEAHKNKMKIAFNDWGEHDKYVLKADWIDISHARNVVSARLWSDIVASRKGYDTLPELYRKSPNNCVIDGFIIKVFANGVYQGRYSFNIPKDPWMFNMDDSLDTHAVLYGEDYNSSCFRAAAVINGNDWTDEMHEDNPPQAIVTRWNQVISFVRTSSDAEFVAGINNYINLRSLIDYFIFVYVCCGIDSLGKNQVYLTYDGNLFYASMYDMDSTWGLYWDGSKFVSAEYRMQEDYEVGKHGTSNLLFDRLKNLFAPSIKKRYDELRKGVLSEVYIKDRFKEWCDISSAELVAMDYAQDTADGAFVNMPQKTTNNYDQISSFVTARLAYVDGMIAKYGDGETITDSWAEILANSNYASDYTIGDTKILDLGTKGKILMQIVGINADTKTSGGKAGLTWFSTTELENHAISNSASTEGGWESCELRNYLSTTILPLMPEVLRNGIVAVNKTQGVYVNGSSVKNGQTTSDKLWAPSLYEMFGYQTLENRNAEPYTTVFYSDAQRIRTLDGNARSWWMRSVNDGTHYAFVNNAGKYGSGDPLAGIGICIGFCTN